MNLIVDPTPTAVVPLHRPTRKRRGDFVVVYAAIHIENDGVVDATVHDGGHRGLVFCNCFYKDLALAVTGAGIDVVFGVVANHRDEVVAELSAKNREFGGVAKSGFVAAFAAPFDEVFELLGDRIERRDSWRRG